MKPQFLDNAILFYGPRKSGSTLLMNLLDGGSNLLMLPGELKLKPQVRRQFTAEDRLLTYLQKGRKDMERLTVVNREAGTVDLREGFSFENLSEEQTREVFDAPAYIERMRTLLGKPPATYHELVRFDVETFAASVRPARDYTCWGAKEVGGADSQTVVNFFRSEFPGARIVLQAREPMFIVRSIIMDRKREGRTLKPGAVWRECRQAQEIIDYVYENIGREIVVTYEHLTRDTEGEARRLAENLGVPFEPVFCGPTTLGVPVVVRTASQKTTAVFQQSSDWTRDLSSLQKATMKLFLKTAPGRFKREGKTYIEYPRLLEKLEASRN